MSLRQLALSSFLWSFSERFLFFFISFFISIILARILDPEDYGLLGLTYIFTGLSTVLVNSGLTNSIIRKKSVNNSDYSTVFIFNFLASIFLYIIIFFTAPLVAKFYEQVILTDIVRLYSLTIILDALGSIHKTKLTKSLNFKRMMFVSLPALIISSLVSVGMAYSGFGVWSLVFGALFYSFSLSLLYWISTTWRFKLKFDFQKFKEHFNFGYKLTFAGILNIVFDNLFYLVIGKRFTVSEVGFYQKAESIKNIPVKNLSLVMDKITYPLFAKVQDNAIQLKRAYRDIMQMVMFIICPIMMVLIVLSDEIFVLLYTEKWSTSALFFNIIALGSVFQPIKAYNANILKIKGRTDMILKMVISVRIISIFIIIIALNFGIYHLLWSQVFIALIFFLVYSFFAGRLIDYSLLNQLLDILPSLVLSSLIGGLIQLLKLKLSFDNMFLSIMIISLIGIITYYISAKVLKLNALKKIEDIIKSRLNERK